MKRLLIATIAAAALAGCAVTEPRSTEPVAVKVLAINDFHGNLKPPSHRRPRKIGFMPGLKVCAVPSATASPKPRR